LQTLSRLLQGETLRAQLLRDGIGSLLLKLAHTFFGLVLAILLARILGPEGYGTYAYVFTLISFMSIPAQLGLPTLVVRETAKAQVKERWDLMKGVWQWASWIASFISFALVAISGFAAWLFMDRFTNVQLSTFAWGLALLPLIALGNLRGASLQGLRKVIKGQLPEKIVRPALLILLVLITYLWFTNGELNSAQVMGLHGCASAIAFVVGVWLLRREWPEQLVSSLRPTYKNRAWLASAIPLAFIASMHLINTQVDILMLGLFSTTEEVGIYQASVRGAQFTSFGLSIIGITVLPHCARLYVQGDMVKIQQLATASARVCLLLALPFAIPFLLLGRHILYFLFGSDYSSGYVVLALLAVAQVINASFGSIGPLLNMAGYERDTAHGIAIAAICNVVLNIVLIPLYGMNGAALATVITLVIWNGLLWNAAWVRLGIDTTAFSIARLMRRAQ
jgi:O-antigen/teichoic acid export membrane protein